MKKEVSDNKEQKTSTKAKKSSYSKKKKGKKNILNGIAYHDSGLIPYGGPFLVFADYMRG